MSILPLLALGLLVNAVMAAAAFWRRAVDAGGAAAGLVIGTLVFAAGGPFFWLVLGAFFLSSTALGRIGRKGRERTQGIVEKGNTRDFLQVLANGGAAAVLALLYRLTGDPAFAVAFAAAFASSNADTWASEVGVLSRRPPVSILSFRPVPAGISGGVSAAGTAASLAGSLFIALIFSAVQELAARTAGGMTPPGDRAGFLALAGIVAAAGFFGSLVDSLLGASVQALYTAQETGALTERQWSGAQRNTLVRGLAIVTNDVVNLASSAAAAAGGVLLYRLFG
jgi:uncharacterized protein (TIGR00297 family)